MEEEVMDQKLECDYWGTLLLITPIDSDSSHVWILGLVERAYERIPPELMPEYLRLLDEYRAAFDSRAEQIAAYNKAKGI